MRTSARVSPTRTTRRWRRRGRPWSCGQRTRDRRRSARTCRESDLGRDLTDEGVQLMTSGDLRFIGHVSVVADKPG
jgi:hypothetical protein